MRVSFDVDRYSEHIRNSRVKHNDQVTKELEHLGKFYMPENGGEHKKPMVVVDCHGRILLWYLPEVLSTARLVRVNSLWTCPWSNHPKNIARMITTLVSPTWQATSHQSWETSLGAMKASDKPPELESLGQEFKHSLQVVLCRVMR